MTPVVTAVFLVAMTVILIAIDVVLWRDSTDGNTYSEVIRNTWRKHRWFGMIIIFSFGLLAGHWFWIVLLFSGSVAGWNLNVG